MSVSWRRRSHRFGLALVLLVLAACGGTRARSARTMPSDVAPVDANDAAAFAVAMNEFGLDVWQGLRTGGHDGNLAISPASLATALAMTYGGARGDTATAMARALHLASSPDATMPAAGALIRNWNEPRSMYQLAVANRLFAEQQYAFREAYLAATRDHYGAEVQRLDFRGAPDPSRILINEWVMANTQDRIRDLLPAGSIQSDTRLVLVNAVYFHGNWSREFDRDQTTDLPFFTGGSEQVSVPTMRMTGGRYGEDDGVQLLELPYTGDDLSMLLVLPRDRGGVAAIEQHLDAAMVTRWSERLGERHDLDIQLPRFRIETESIALSEILHALGMAIAFSDQADFSGISEPSEVPLKIADVFHRVFLDVNEEGTEAAAATGVVMAESMSAGPRPEPPRFHADHPFLFFLRDVRSGAILFAGRVVDPR